MNLIKSIKNNIFVLFKHPNLFFCKFILIRNVSQFDNIEYYNFAVVNRKKHSSSELDYYKSDEFDYGGNLYDMYDKKHKIKIKSIGNLYNKLNAREWLMFILYFEKLI